MRHIKYRPRLMPINEDLTASMMLLKRGTKASQAKRNILQRKRVVVEVVRAVGPPAATARQTPTPQQRKAQSENLVEPATVKVVESSENAAEPVTLQPLRNRADTALAAPPSPPAVVVATPAPASVKVENKYSRNALHDAVRKGDLVAVKHLLATRPEMLRGPDIRGNQPIHYAANGTGPDAAEIVFVLLKAGAFVNAVNERQQTPLLIHVIASKTDDDTIVRILLHNNAKPLVETVDTLMLSQFAASRGLHKIAAALNASK